MSTVADYSGRVVDVVVFQGVLGGGARAELVQALATETSGGTICTGIQKLAQWYIITLCQDLGSVPYDPEQGSRLLASFSNGSIRTETDVYMAFGFAHAPVERYLQGLETDDMPDDERLASAELVRVTLEPGRVALTIRILSVAGTSREEILPIEVV